MKWIYKWNKYLESVLNEHKEKWMNELNEMNGIEWTDWISPADCGKYFQWGWARAMCMAWWCYDSAQPSG